MIDEGKKFGQFRLAAVTILIASYGRGNVGRTDSDVIVNGEARIEFEFLREIANTKATAGRDVSRVRLILIR